MTVDVVKDVRWGEETRDAALHAGWIVVESDGEVDYQGWGVHLLRRCEAASESVATDADLEGKHELAARIRADGGVEWAVLAWSYGSCGGCDQYEDDVVSDGTPEEHHAVFGELIEHCPDEESARLKFSERKGW